MSKSFFIAKKEDGTHGINTNGKGIFFVAEKEYPVTICYSRFDMNGCRISECEDCKTAEETASSLEGHLKCNHMIENIWDFDLDSCEDEKITDIFDKLYDKSVEILYQSMEALMG